MAWNTSAKCKVHLGTQTPETDVSGYESDTYDEIGEIENVGDFGDQYSIVPFNSLDSGRTQKRKGTADAGDMDLTVALDPDDAGQTAVQTALDDTSAVPFNIKVELNDAPSGGTPTTFYFAAFVTSGRAQIGGNDSVVMRQIQLAITTEILQEDAAEPV